MTLVAKVTASALAASAATSLNGSLSQVAADSLNGSMVHGRSLGSMELKVAAVGDAIPSGVHLTCFGPYVPPSGARSLRRLQPEVNMEIVHHMIMFAGKGSRSSRTLQRANSPMCNQGQIVYAWARTGQTTPIGLDFAEAAGDLGFAIGPGTSYEWFALQIHYQQLAPAPVHDSSGVHLYFGPTAPKKPLDVQLMASWRLRVPPLVKMDECVACRVAHGGVAVAWRNHAHRLARDIYSEHFDREGQPLPQLGFISAQQPQIFRLLPETRPLSTGDALLLHCNYDATAITDHITYLGADERTHEMCNQYLMATDGLRLACGTEALEVDNSVSAAFDAACTGLPAPSIGQITGLAFDDATNTLYAFHRSGNTFVSSALIQQPAILAFSLLGAITKKLSRNVFTVPHGLSIDHHGKLWATDVAQHRIFRIDPTRDVVELTLGAGRGRSATQFDKPTDVAVNAQTEEVFVADGYGNSRVAVYRYDGTYLREFGTVGNADGQFRVPHSIVIDKRGDVYVADRENSRVQVFYTNGTHKATWLSRVATGLERAVYARHVSSIAYHATLDLFVVTEGDGVVLRTPSGCDIAQVGGPLLWPHDALVLPLEAAKMPQGAQHSAAHAGAAANRSALADGGVRVAVFVAELDGKRIKKFVSSSGERKFESSGGGYGRRLAEEIL